MIRRNSIAAMVALIVALAVPGWSAFQVADLVYVPVVSAGTGANDSVWRSDVIIYNADETDIDVAIVFLPSGLFSNASRFRDRQTWLGGRESDDFGIIEESLADIPPGGTVAIENIVGTYWPDDAGVNGNGALVVFAYEADTLEDDGTRVFRNAIVNSRTYNQTSIFEPDPDNEGEFVERDTTYGQTIPGVPWYNLAYAEEFTEDEDLSSQLLLGGVENDEFRYNVGILNTSDPQTQLTVRLQPYQRDGTPFVDAEGNPIFSIISVPPLAHLQYFRVMSNLFGIDPAEEDLTDVTIRISWIGWQTTSVEPVPAITTYGSIVDAVSNDPTTVLPSFGEPYPVDCVWFTDPEAKTSAVSGGSRAARPVEIPPR
jgi:hypothetical protein